MNDKLSARRFTVSGVVQGVGFRPFVYNLASRHGLTGTVANTDQGVLIHAEGRDDCLRLFKADLLQTAPPISRISAVSEQATPAVHYRTFTIVQSSSGMEKSVLMSPDIAVCDDCLNELFDPADRRYGYPFINCTNCGPRYTIINDLPYDRDNTSMRCFDLCDHCRSEFEDPINRRFHAQPNACPVCGPVLSVLDSEKRPVAIDDPVRFCAGLIGMGSILAVKGLGGFHLSVDATNEAAVQRLRSRKHRPAKPLALMAGDVHQIREYAVVDRAEKNLLESFRRPIVLLRKKTPNLIAPDVAPGNACFGVMLPYTPLHYLLLRACGRPLVMTSANISDEPIIIDNQDALDRLSGIADFFLVHNRDIAVRSDDSIVFQAAGRERPVRRSRGYAPLPVFLSRPVPPILACGGHLKNTFCLAKEDRAFVSQHIGDLDSLETFDYYRETLAHLERLLDIRPQMVAHDAHPDYVSTAFAKTYEETRGCQTVAVQHHHAHIVAGITENGLTGRVIGLALDGTGYGSDGCVWGGEILIAEAGGFTRAGHLADVPLPGGDVAAREPWRMAAAYLRDAFGEEARRLDLPLMNQIGANKLDLVFRMISQSVNTPLTSSLGRLFDGVAALAGLAQYNAFEGQAAMALEAAAMNAIASSGDNDVYDYDLSGRDVYRLDLPPLIRGVVADIRAGRPKEIISARFHRTVIVMFADVCDRVKKDSGLERVVLSGGVFQNRLLLEGFEKELARRGFAVYSHSRVPTNDGGISLGQAVAAAAMIDG